jgi:hypothetical protein
VKQANGRMKIKTVSHHNNATAESINNILEIQRVRAQKEMIKCKCEEKKKYTKYKNIPLLKRDHQHIHSFELPFSLLIL